ncbi:hypothetical protein OESDEN_03204 [Oesophagostomum dentatum]|uniref:Peptidase A2 domain-containing protein n=1 Tax=Oesophagostomum dentatum TaxID=61180 RepID=A0A0B1THT3_OESDE|nr:hypothetical protein OESDEN_03204 [Oesophagostomum dentatum]
MGVILVKAQSKTAQSRISLLFLTIGAVAQSKEQTVIEAKVLGRTERVLLDTGSQISIIPLKALAHDLDNNVEVIPLPSGTLICDASGSQMWFKRAVKVAASLGKTAPQKIVMFVQETEDDKLVFGTNALQKFGLNARIIPSLLLNKSLARKRKPQAEKKGRG